MPCEISSKVFISLRDILFITFSIFLCSGLTAAAAKHSPNNIGVIIDVNTRIGREEKIAMDIATEDLNRVLGNKINLVLHINDSGGMPSQASTAAHYLLKENEVQAILGMERWPEAVSVAESSKKAKIPALTLATSLITFPQMSTRWPFLVRMANNDYQEMRCVASLVGSYQWRRVIVIYEHDGYSSESGIQALLLDELRVVGSEVEYWLAIPPLSTLSDPEFYIGEELEKLDKKTSRVFIVIGCSLEMAFHIVTEAKDIGLMGKHSVWITTASVTNLLHSANKSIISSMKGIIGIKTHFSKTNPRFLNFSMEFTKRIRKIYPDEDKSEPGINALRAYDTVSATASALASLTNNSYPTSGELLRNILSSNFNGLSGKIQLNNGESSHSSTYEIVNVLHLRYKIKGLKFWSSEYGFSDNPIDEMSAQEKNRTRGNVVLQTDVLGGVVDWPGRLKSVPVGWAMPVLLEKGVTPQVLRALVQYWPVRLHNVPVGRVMPSDAKPMIIGIPGRTRFQKFVKCGEEPTGYCIDLFKEAIRELGYNLSYKFECYNGKYDELVRLVYAKKFDAAVGDITILAERSKYVDFTQSYMESRLTMVVPVALKVEENAWLFVKPFTAMMWLWIFFVFVYTMLVVWILEHRSNPDFKGPQVNQFSTALWFTFSSLFFAHKESNIRSNYTRAVMFVWFCAVYVIATSYQASLTSMLTVQHLNPISDVEQIKRSNAVVGCDRNSFVGKYIEEVLGFLPGKILDIRDPYDYPKALQNGTISAAFLERPYKSLILNSEDYKDTVLRDTIGGFGFAFPLGSPLAEEFSTAFLKLGEDGTLNKLHEKWLPPNPLDSSSASNIEEQRLNPSNFKGLFLVTGITSTVMLIFYIMFGRRHCPPTDPANTGELRKESNEPHSSSPRTVSHLMSLDAKSLNDFYTPGQRQQSQQREIQMQETYAEDPGNQTKSLRRAMAFPSPDRRASGVNAAVSPREPIAHSTSLPSRM